MCAAQALQTCQEGEGCDNGSEDLCDAYMLHHDHHQFQADAGSTRVWLTVDHPVTDPLRLVSNGIANSI
jgi:hypothetical protein